MAVSSGLRVFAEGADWGFFWREGLNGAGKRTQGVRAPYQLRVQNSLFKNVQFGGGGWAPRHCPPSPWPPEGRGPPCLGKGGAVGEM